MKLLGLTVRYDEAETERLIKDYPSTSLKSRRKLRVYNVKCEGDHYDSNVVTFGWYEVVGVHAKSIIYYVKRLTRKKGGV
jgi:hypothetical protein